MKYLILFFLCIASSLARTQTNTNRTVESLGITPGGSNANCVIDLKCASWYNDAVATYSNAVCAIASQGSTDFNISGSGFLVANEEKKPYVLTAAHVLKSSYKPWEPNSSTDAVENIYCIFNYENNTCNGQPERVFYVKVKRIVSCGFGYLDIRQTIDDDRSKEFLSSDYMLLELEEYPEKYSPDVFYLGWNRNYTLSNAHVNISHPNKDVKKTLRSTNMEAVTINTIENSGFIFQGQIERDDDEPLNAIRLTQSSSQGISSNGSSGAPLIDLNTGLAVGLVTGGLNHCDNVAAPEWYSTIDHVMDHPWNYTVDATIYETYMKPNNPQTWNFTHQPLHEFLSPSSPNRVLMTGYGPCSNGRKDYFETGIDCGGPCISCTNFCNNQIKDGDETGVDCGGSCTACSGDGSQDNGGDDCGGNCSQNSVAVTKTATISYEHRNTIRNSVGASLPGYSTYSVSKAGYESIGSFTIGNLTQYYYRTYYKFDLSNIPVSDITKVTLKYTMHENGLGPGALPADIRIISPSANCQSSNNQAVFNCLGTGTFLKDELDISTHRSGTVDVTSILDGSAIRIGFHGINQSGAVRLSNVQLEVEYKCYLAHVPTNLTSPSVSADAITLNWNDASGATSYEVYNCNGGLVKTTTSSQTTITGLSSNTNYYYKVRALNSCGTSDFGTCKSFKTSQSPIVMNSGYSSSNTDVSFSWQSVNGVSYYEIYDCQGNFVKQTNSNSTTVNNLTPGKIYYFKVRAIVSGVEGPFSSCKEMHTYADPLNPVIITDISSTSVRVTWPTTEVTSRYSVYDCNGALLGTAYGSNSNSLVISNLNPDTEYGFAVSGFYERLVGTTVRSTCVNARTLLPQLSGVNATATENTIQLTWDLVNDADQYFVYDCDDNLLLASTTNNVTIDGLTPGTYYCYRVQYVKNGKISELSTPVNIYTTTEIPNNVLAVANSSSEIQISWDPQGENAKYEIYDCMGELLAATNEASYVFTGLVPNTDYSFKVRSGIAASFSEFAPCINTTTPLTAPTNVDVIRVNDQTIRLTWDLIPDVTDYQVYSCDGTLLGSTSSNEIVLNASTGTHYCFQFDATAYGTQTGLASNIDYAHKLSTPEPWIEVDPVTKDMHVKWVEDKYPVGTEIVARIELCDGTSWTGYTTLTVGSGGIISYTFPYNSRRIVDASSFYGYYGNYPSMGINIKVQTYGDERDFSVLDLSLGSEESECVFAYTRPTDCIHTWGWSENSIAYFSNPQVGHFRDVYFHQDLRVDEKAALWLEAQDYIILKPGSHLEAGSNVQLNIRECPNSSRFGDDLGEAEEENDAQNDQLIVYPNPTEGTFRISPLNSNKVYSLIVFDQIGNQLISQESFDTNQLIDLSGHPSGIYFVRLISDGEVLTTKLVLL